MANKFGTCFNFQKFCFFLLCFLLAFVSQAKHTINKCICLLLLASGATIGRSGHLTSVVAVSEYYLVQVHIISIPHHALMNHESHQHSCYLDFENTLPSSCELNVAHVPCLCGTYSFCAFCKCPTCGSDVFCVKDACFVAARHMFERHCTYVQCISHVCSTPVLHAFCICFA